MKRGRRRRHYRRLNEEKKVRSHWKLGKIRVIVPKLKRKNKSLIKLLRRFRDAYVQMMLCFAGRLMQFNTGNVFLFKRIPRAANLFFLRKKPDSQPLLS